MLHINLPGCAFFPVTSSCGPTVIMLPSISQLV
jgi:hypothetical protein